MGAIEGMRLALGTIWSQKLRSGLTLLANIVAVMSVIAVVSILGGMDQYVREKVVSEGTGVFTIQRVDFLKILTSFDEFLESLRNPNLGPEDAEFLRERLTLAEHVGAERTTNARVESGDRYVEGVSIRGREESYAYMRDWKLAAGRHLSPVEVDHRAAVAVIGHVVAETLFPGADPIGKTVRVAGRHLRVIGVVEEQGFVLGENQDLFVFVPLGVFQ
jgi:putative ABC transport system permease protein